MENDFTLKQRFIVFPPVLVSLLSFSHVVSSGAIIEKKMAFVLVVNIRIIVLVSYYCMV